MRRLRSYLRQHGFSLAEVMVASGMLGVISLGLMKLSETQNKQQKKMRVDFNISNLMYEASIVNRNIEACISTFDDIDLRTLPDTPLDLTEIKLNDTNTVITTDTTDDANKYGIGSGGTIEVQTIQVVSTNPTPVTVAGLTPTTYTLKVRVKMKRSGSATGAFGGQTVTRQFNVQVIDNDENGIIDFTAPSGDSCVNESIALDTICQTLGGVVDPLTARCVNIDLLNNSAMTTPSFEHFAITARGGLQVTEDTEPYSNNPAHHWQMTASNDVDSGNSIFSLSYDADGDPTADKLDMLQLSSDHSLINTFSDSYIFSSAEGTDLVTINSEGDMFLGEIPDAEANHGKLYIRNDVDYSTDIFAKNASLFISNQQGSSPASIVLEAGSTSGTSGLGSITYDGENQFLGFYGSAATANNTQVPDAGIDSSGNFGIGTRTPSSKLHIAGDSDSARLRLERTGSSVWEFVPSGGELSIIDQTSGIANIRATFDSAGRLGIGTTTPGALFEVEGGDTYFDGGFAYLDQSPTDIGPPSSSPCATEGCDGRKLVTKDWVFQNLTATIGSGLTDVQKQAIVQHILNTDGSMQWPEMKIDVLNDINSQKDDAGSYGASEECGAGEVVTGIKYSVNTGLSQGQIRFKCAVGGGTSCATKENCPNVYAGSGSAGKLCVRDGGGTFTCISSGQVTYSANCSTVSVSSVNGWNNMICPGNTVVRTVNYYFNSGTDATEQMFVECCEQHFLGAE